MPLMMVMPLLLLLVLALSGPGLAAEDQALQITLVELQPEPAPPMGPDQRPHWPAGAAVDLAILGLDDLAGLSLVFVDARSGAVSQHQPLGPFASSPVLFTLPDSVFEGHLELRRGSRALARWPEGQVVLVHDQPTASGDLPTDTITSDASPPCPVTMDGATDSCDLRAAALAGYDLRTMDFSRRDLSRADLRGARLDDSILRGAVLDGALLNQANLQGADLSGASLVAADLSDASLLVADLGGADLRSSRLQGADLTHANLAGARLDGADLSGAQVTGASLSGASLDGATCPSGELATGTPAACRLR